MPENRKLVQDLTNKLAVSEARLRNVIERSPDAIVIVDRQGMAQFANRAAEALFNAHGAGLVGRPFGLPLASGETTVVDIVGAQGEDQIAEMRVMEAEWDGKEAYAAVLRDITERSRVERALKENEKRLTLAMDVALLGFWDFDVRTGRVTCNDKAYEVMGYLPGEIEPWRDAWSKLVSPLDLPQASQAFDDHLLGKTARFLTELRWRAKAGDWFWMRVQGEVVERDEAGQPLRVIGVVEDITERKAVEERILHVSQHDTLTGLPNRTLLYEYAEHVIEGARRGGRQSAFLFLDLDRFKPINDTYGHDVGDAVLKEVSRRLAASVRGEDLVGRLGGDEFLTLLPHVRSEEDAASVARHALQGMDQPFLVDGLVLRVSPSIGISLFPQDGGSVGDLIKNADTAMYHAKANGRNNFQFFKQEFNDRVAQSLHIESLMRNALEHGEFALFYQPVVNTETGGLVGAEALLRWPGRNFSPEQVIPVAETAGFMHMLGKWVVQEACRQQREWRDKGLAAFPVAVNVSPTQFRQKGFARSVIDTLEQEGIEAQYLCVELTESTVMTNVDQAAAVLSELKASGIKVALDDFGTGYSSLSYLDQLPIDILKLDQSFIKSIGRNGSRTAIAEGIIALGQSLGLEIVAEGIETEEALAFLVAHQCRRGQGYHFSRPMPAHAFEQWSLARAA